jgi:hypothetical protein
MRYLVYNDIDDISSYLVAKGHNAMLTLPPSVSARTILDGLLDVSEFCDVTKSDIDQIKFQALELLLEASADAKLLGKDHYLIFAESNVKCSDIVIMHISGTVVATSDQKLFETYSPLSLCTGKVRRPAECVFSNFEVDYVNECESLSN